MISATSTPLSGGSTGIQSMTFNIVLNDACSSTKFLEETISDMGQFIGSAVPVLSITLPVLTDTTNQLYGTDAKNSICG